ncbi:hypothetical protein GCM10009601_51140 [Streptomyces thermospinosisporus]|uniref:Uncharacterized protein n=1 Tax=Streptomyces thermospinosisporus TaxID=161482 RepID=A0ABP4JVD9_9ACTN
MTTLTEQQITALARLREPFPDTEIRYLPRVWCGACRDMKGACKNHQRVKCQKCRNSISSAHIDLAYVGHAEATNRLLNVDPGWTWEPVSLDERGLPQYDQNGGLWIRLTVCGVTRLGYGNAEGKRGGDAVKEIIGDAIRNAGMRFGMALDLWTSSDLEIAEHGPRDTPAEPPAEHRAEMRQRRPAPSQGVPPEQRLADEAGKATDPAGVRDVYRKAKDAGVLAATVKVGEETQELGKFLISRGKQLAEPAPAEGQADDEGVVEGELVESVDAGLTPYHGEHGYPEGESPEEQAQAAEKELRAAAATAGLDNLDEEFERSYGLPISEAGAQQLREMTAILTGSAA